MQFTEAWQEEEWLKCASSFDYCASEYFEIRSLEHGSVKFKMYPYQERVLRDFERYRFNILRKFRQGGLTTLSVLWTLWMCMFRENKQTLVISKTDTEAVKAGKMARRVLDGLQMDHPWLAPRLSSDSKHIMTFMDTRSEIEFGGPSRARGQSLNYVIVDEAAFIDKMEEVWADMYPTVATGGSVIVVSTVNGIGNWYHKMWVDAKAERNGFNIIDLHYTEHPQYRKPGWAEEARANLGERLFAQEILGSFLGSGETYISPETLAKFDRDTQHKRILKKLFKEWDHDKREFDLHEQSEDPELQNWDKGALWVWQEPQEGHEYVMGVDVAEGVGEDGDASAFHVFDATTLEQVAEFLSNTVPPNVFAMIVARVGVYYNTALVAVENAGPGIAILDKLSHNLYYENIYCQRTKTQERMGVTMSKTTRPVILEAMQNYLENDLVKLCSSRLVRELETFKYNRGRKRAEAERGHHDDLVMSLGIALYVRDRHMRDVPTGIKLPENIVDSVASRKFEQIRREIENSAPEDLLAKQEDDQEPWEMETVLPGIIMPYNRPQDAICKEFGW
jgi:hypothetical protein